VQILKNKLNILYLYDYMKLGGAETHIITLSKAIKDLGHNVYIAAPNGPAVKWIKEENIIFLECSLDNWNEQFESLKRIVSSIEHYDIDIIHAHPFNSQIIGSLAAYVTRKPCVTTIHGEYETPALENFLKPLFSKYVCVGDNIKNLYIKYGIKAEDVQVIKNTVEIRELSQKADFFKNGIVNLCYISRLDDDKIKTLEFLLNALSELRKYLHIRLTIVGEGTHLERIKLLSETINAEFNDRVVSVVGGTTDVFKYIEKSDIVVGIGRVLLEALSAGKFAICIGDTYYTGPINTSNFMKLSEFNFTGRNMKNELRIDSLINDIREIYFDFDNKFKELVAVYNILKDSFSVNSSARKHINCYNEVIDSFTDNIFEFDSSYRVTSYPLSEELKLLFLGRNYNNKRLLYHFVDSKQTKILICPDFKDKKDCWKICLENLFAKYDNNSDVTIVIRIGNEYIDCQESIIDEIGSYISLFNIEVLPDILLDIDYHDKEVESCFLASVDIFISTNDNQLNEIIKCKLANVEVYKCNQTVESGFKLTKL